jgi:hypothetical protein
MLVRRYKRRIEIEQHTLRVEQTVSSQPPPRPADNPTVDGKPAENTDLSPQADESKSKTIKPEKAL